MWGSGTSESGFFKGIQAWAGNPGEFASVGASVFNSIVSGDLDTGVLTLRFRVITTTAADKILNASSTNTLHVWAKNHGPVGV